MNEAQHPQSAARQPLLRFFFTFTLTFLVYALGSMPAFKMTLMYPAIDRVFGRPVEIIYAPLIAYLRHHPYTHINDFYFWYATEVCNLPIYRDRNDSVSHTSGH